MGGFNNKKTTTSERTTLVLDNIELSGTPTPPSNDVTILSGNFDDTDHDFTYSYGLFGSTEPAYADGQHITSGGFSGGALRIILGGINNDDIDDMSGGWTLPFSLPSEGNTTLTLRYKLTQTSNYESSETSRALAQIDGVLVGSGPGGSLAQIGGNGNGGGEITTGWQQLIFDLGILSEGSHSIDVGGYNNRKTYNDESTEVLFDDIEIVLAQ